ncbi:MAG: SAM-dependent methyltransferase [Halieaceae bacterium]|jgi:SAM-dependent methyltransferase
MSYNSTPGHHSMILDRVRNEAYARAIKAAVTEDSVVLDLGAGLGILGFIAAKAGAKKVYSVEPAPVIEAAKMVAKANGLTNVEFIQATAEQLELPEQVDLIISVFTGNFLLTEDLLPALFYARDKFLKPGGKLLPDCANMMVAPISCEDYYQKSVAHWSNANDEDSKNYTLGVDYSLVQRYSANSLYYDTAKAFEADLLAEPLKLIQLDFNTATEAEVDHKTDCRVDKSATCHGWLGWFDMRLGDDWLSTGPNAEPTHWSQVLMPLDPPIEITAGDQLKFQLKRPTFGEWTWTTTSADNQQRQSTFLSEPLTPQGIAKKSDRYSPAPSHMSRAAMTLLELLDGEKDTVELATHLQTQFPELFPTATSARKFVRQLIKRY